MFSGWENPNNSLQFLRHKSHMSQKYPIFSPKRTNENSPRHNPHMIFDHYWRNPHMKHVSNTPYRPESLKSLPAAVLIIPQVKLTT
jgi:hypothetical protein